MYKDVGVIMGVTCIVSGRLAPHEFDVLTIIVPVTVPTVVGVNVYDGDALIPDHPAPDADQLKVSAPNEWDKNTGAGPPKQTAVKGSADGVAGGAVIGVSLKKYVSPSPHAL